MITKIFKSSLLKAGVIYTLCDAINRSVPFLILPLLSYHLTPSDYGIVANFNVLTSIVSIIVLVGVDGAIGVNFYKLSKEVLPVFIGNSIFITSVGSICTIFLAILVKDYIYEYLKIPFDYILLLLLMSIAAVFTSINLIVFRLEEKPWRFGLYQVFQTLLNVGISLFLVINLHLGWKGRVDGILISTALFGVGSLVMLLASGYIRFDFNLSLIKRILFFGLPLIPHSLGMWIRSSIDRIYITKMYGELSNGLYATGFLFGTLLSFLVIAFNNAFVPYLYKGLSEEDPTILQEKKKTLRKITLSGVFLLMFLCSLFYIISIGILNNFFERNYQGAEPFILWALVAQMFQGFYLLFVNYIFFAKRTKILASLTLSCAVAQAILSYYLISDLGPIGGAYSTAIISCINFIVVMILSNKVYPMGWFLLKRN